LLLGKLSDWWSMSLFRYLFKSPLLQNSRIKATSTFYATKEIKKIHFHFQKISLLKQALDFKDFLRFSIFFVTAPNNSTIFGWYPMYIKIFSSAKAALKFSTEVPSFTFLTATNFFPGILVALNTSPNAPSPMKLSASN